MWIWLLAPDSLWLLEIIASHWKEYIFFWWGLHSLGMQGNAIVIRGCIKVDALPDPKASCSSITFLLSLTASFLMLIGSMICWLLQHHITTSKYCLMFSQCSHMFPGAYQQENLPQDQYFGDKYKLLGEVLLFPATKAEMAIVVYTCSSAAGEGNSLPIHRLKFRWSLSKDFFRGIKIFSEGIFFQFPMDSTTFLLDYLHPTSDCLRTMLVTGWRLCFENTSFAKGRWAVLEQEQEGYAGRWISFLINRMQATDCFHIAVVSPCVQYFLTFFNYERLYFLFK